MTREIKLNRLHTLLSELEYPIRQDAAVSETDDVTLILADGTASLGETIARSTADEFASADELESEVMSLLPRRSVGEPYQSEGEG